MTPYPVQDSEARETLKIACRAFRDNPEHFASVVAAVEKEVSVGRYVPITWRAFCALADPEQSAAIIRVELERCDVEVIRAVHGTGVCFVGPFVGFYVGSEGDEDAHAFGIEQAPALIRRLLDVPDGDTDGALTALRDGAGP